ncbi:preprotein translocase subunit SecA [Anatilimnocola aggregata]|uniref:Protein translocase subunit SecA n=1 Tax=Anatilimnocola aggregata TaxID=2528021 RepID=A0A517Y794_9BACT|nr:preprotein translocase subunit SecA [Anatilimnocola aggregata]QDU26108.1 preprotein translocase subunit SecA [Anatilimnocola aggregata]
MSSTTSVNGIPQGWQAKMLSWLGGPIQRRLAQWGSQLQQINAFEPMLAAEEPRDLRKRSLALRYRAKAGEPLASLVPEGYALVREAAKRAIQQRHYDVQMIGGMALFYGCIAEMETGEGKTLTATLPTYLHALIGKGSHVATVNDYLAERDAAMMRPVYEVLGMSTGIVLTPDTQDTRRKAYACDITYGTAKEFGFDFLRDRLLLRRMGMAQSNLLNQLTSARMEMGGEMPVQREHHFCLVDEADSILIDEARTPLIIGSLGEKAIERIVTLYRWAAEVVPQFLEEEHYEYEHDEKKIELSTEGRQLVRSMPKPEILRGVGLIDLYQYVERAIKCKRDFLLDRHYVVKEGEIVIVDENTGRLAEGRKWRDGIHQAIEAQERIDVSVPTGQAARITIQDLFLRYKHLAGMTGTASSAAREFKKVYKMRVIPVPTNRPVQRKRLPDRVYGTADQKWRAIVEDVREAHIKRRPVLIGTRSIDKSVILSKLLTEKGIPHQVLNAHEVATEAEIVARAGEEGKVTVATNMAGRGTDIKLQQPVKDLGGLHVICTELHDSARIDRQLMGRCGRQGDPGTVQQYMSLDDDVLRTGFGPQTAEKMTKVGEQDSANPQKYLSLLQRAQRKVERRHLRDRFVLLFHEKERKKMQQEMGQDPYLDTPD